MDKAKPGLTQFFKNFVVEADNPEMRLKALRTLIAEDADDLVEMIGVQNPIGIAATT